MAEYTNMSRGVRIVAVTKGKETSHVSLAPGETKDLDGVDTSSRYFKGLLAAKELIEGKPDDPAPKNAAGFKRKIDDLTAKVEELTSENTDLKVKVEELTKVAEASKTLGE